VVTICYKIVRPTVLYRTFHCSSSQIPRKPTKSPQF